MELILVVSIVGFTAAFAGIKIFPPLLTAPRFARKYLLLLLAAVIALLAYFLLYYFVARFPLLESFLEQRRPSGAARQAVFRRQAVTIDHDHRCRTGGTDKPKHQRNQQTTGQESFHGHG